MGQTYLPIVVLPKFDSSLSGLLRLEWSVSTGARTVKAHFDVPGTQSELHVEFQDAEIVRVVDEFAISTEDTAGKEGVVPRHFAYQVLDSDLLRPFGILTSSIPNLVHYQFVTANTCLDIVSRYPPRFSTTLVGD